MRIHVHGQGSDIEQDTVLSVIHTFRRGNVIMIEFFLEHEEALEATRPAGVSDVGGGPADRALAHSSGLLDFLGRGSSWKSRQVAHSPPAFAGARLRLALTVAGAG